MSVKKVLFIATVVKTHINVFHLPYIKMFKEKGYETFVAAKNDYETKMPDIPYCDNYVDIPFARSPFGIQNIKAYKELKALIDNNDFDIIHCNTPVGGVIGRIAANKTRKQKGTKVVYIAHGFHFFRGGSKLAWLMFYPIEKILAHITDILITINQEDYNIALSKFKAKETIYVRGIGVDLDKCENCTPDKKKIRSKLGLNDGDILITSIGELIKRKNHKTVINAISILNNSKIHYAILGSGKIENELKELVNSLGLNNNVHFLGFCDNVYEILKSSDIFCFPSRQEGLPVALMEAMASSLPVVASKVRGNTDLIIQNKGGLLFNPNDVKGFASGIKTLIDNEDLCRKMGKYNKERVKKYALKTVKEQFVDIYFSDKHSI